MCLCPKAKECSIFSELNLIQLLQKTIKKKYCNKNFEKCARYQLLKEDLAVPKNLLPHDKICRTCEQIQADKL